MVASEHPEVIEGRRQLIATDVIDSEEEDEDGYIDNYSAASDEEDDIGLGEAGVRTGVAQSGTEEVEEVHWVLKYSSLSSYMLKTPSLLTRGVNKNNKAQEKILKNMHNFGAWVEWNNGRRAVSSYLDVDIRNDQYRLINPNPLYCISGYIVDGNIGDRALKRLPQQRLPQLSLNIIDGYISSYLYILNCTERLHIIKQVNELESVICDI